MLRRVSADGTQRRIAILGGGIAGLSTAAWLAQLGARDVVLLERGRELARESSRRSACVVRSASDDACLEEFALASARALARPPRWLAEAEAAEGRVTSGERRPLRSRSFVARAGLVLLGRGAAAPAGGWERRVALQRHARALTPAELTALAPDARTNGEDAWFFPEEGVLAVDELLDALARAALRGGAELRCDARVVELARVADGFELELDVRGTREHLRADEVVLAAGGWSAPLGARLGSRVTLRPTRRHIFVTLRNPHVRASQPIVWNERAGFYWRPERGGVLACACDTSDADPEEHGVDPAVELAWRAKLREHVRNVALDALQASWSGTRTFAQDERFVIGEDGDVPGLHWVAGLGGHGMTCGFAAGELAARILLEREPDERFVAAFAPARLTRATQRTG